MLIVDRLRWSRLGLCPLSDHLKILIDDVMVIVGIVVVAVIGIYGMMNVRLRRCPGAD